MRDGREARRERFAIKLYPTRDPPERKECNPKLKMGEGAPVWRIVKGGWVVVTKESKKKPGRS